MRFLSLLQGGERAENKVLTAHQEHPPLSLVNVQPAQVIHVRLTLDSPELAHKIAVLGKLQHAVVASVRDIDVAYRIGGLPTADIDRHWAAHRAVKAPHAELDRLPVVVLFDGAIRKEDVHVGVDRHVDGASQVHSQRGVEIVQRGLDILVVRGQILEKASQQRVKYVQVAVETPDRLRA